MEEWEEYKRSEFWSSFSSSFQKGAESMDSEFEALEFTAKPYNEQGFKTWFFENRKTLKLEPQKLALMVLKMNRFLCVCEEGSASSFVWFFTHKDKKDAWIMKTLSALQGIFRMYEAPCFQTRKDVNPPTAFALWLKHPDRLRIESFIFHPRLPVNLIKNEEETVFFNRWTGFGKLKTPQTPEEVELSQEQLSTILFHLKEVLCRGNEEIYNYDSQWLASLIQKPWEKIPVVLIFSGVQGAGKSLFWKFFSEIFGQHGMSTPDASLLTHKFFGEELSDKVFLCIDETEFSDKKEAGRLKNQITSETRKTEKKCKDVRIQDDFVHMVWTSNNPLKSFPAESGYNRRFFPVEVDPTRANKSEYFSELVAAFKGFGLHALFHYLDSLKIDLDLNLPPHTEEKSDTVLFVLDPFEHFWLECLKAKAHHEKHSHCKTDPLQKLWVTQGASTQLLWGIFQKYSPDTKMNETLFLNRLKGMLPSVEEDPGLDLAGAIKEGDYQFTMPRWRECNDFFQKLKGLRNSEGDFVQNKKRKSEWDRESDKKKMGDIRRHFSLKK